MPGYAKLRDLVNALLAQGDVGSSIEILRQSGDDRRRDLDLDWILEFTRNDLPTEHRHASLKCALEREGKSWKIVSLDPIDFFRPQ